MLFQSVGYCKNLFAVITPECFVVCSCVAFKSLFIIGHICTVHILASEMDDSFMLRVYVSFQNHRGWRFEQTIFKCAFSPVYMFLFCLLIHMIIDFMSCQATVPSSFIITLFALN